MAKSKGSRVTQGSRPGEAQKPESVTLKITVPREVAKLLRLEAFGRDCSLGQVVADWARSAPRRFSLVDRGRGSAGAEGSPSPSVPGPSLARGAIECLGVVSSEEVA